MSWFSLTCVQPWILSWFSPTSPDSCVISFSGLSWSDFHVAVYAAHPSTPALHRPRPALPSHPRHVQEATPGPQRIGFFAICPHQPFQLIPIPTRYSTVLASWGSFLTPVCQYILAPLSQSQGGSSVPGHRRKMEDRTCHYLPLLQGVPMPSVFPQPSVDAFDHLWVSPPPRSCDCRKLPQPSMFCPRPLHLLCLLPGMFPQRISGLPCLPI